MARGHQSLFPAALAIAISMLVITPLVAGQCDFPANMTGTNWFTATLSNPPGYFYAVTFNQPGEQYAAYMEGTTSPLGTFTNPCQSGAAVGGEYCYLADTKVGTKCNCVSAQEYALFVRIHDTVGATPTPEECATMIASESTSGTVYPLLKDLSFDYSASPDCPFTAGTYLTDVIHSDASQCAASPMESTVSGNTIELNSCLASSHTYDTPSATNLTCVATFAGSVMDSDANGDILVLADFTENPIHPRYYCARVKMESDKVYMSIYPSLQYTVTMCPFNQTYSSSDTSMGYYEFVLTSTDTEATTAGGPTQEPDATTASSGMGADGACAFPAAFDASDWFTKYTQQAGYYWEGQFRVNISYLQAVGVVNDDDIADPINAVCSSGAEIDGKYCYHLDSSKDGERCFCALASEYAIYLLMTPGVGVTTASECAAKIATDNPAPEVLPKAVGFDYSSSPAWPITAGTYTAEVYTTAGSTECAGDATLSTAQGNVLMIRTCITEATTYETPTMVDLTCVTSWTLTDLGGASTTEGVVVVADTSDAAEPRFYCGFYEISGEDVYLSLALANVQDPISCPVGANARSMGTGFYAFKFGLQDSFATTVSAAGDVTTDAAAPDGTTSAPITAAGDTEAPGDVTTAAQSDVSTAAQSDVSTAAQSDVSTSAQSDVTQAPQDNCVYPPDAEGTYWFINNFINEPGFMWVTGFASPTLTDTVYKRSDGSLVGMPASDDCISGHFVGDDYCFYINHPKTGPQCTTLRHAPGALLRRDSVAPTPKTPEECAMQSIGVNAFVQPQATLDYSASSCSLVTGGYTSQMTSSSGTTMCDEGDPTQVTSQSITFCGASELTCVATFPGSALDEDSNGDILVLADLADLDIPKFYCARVTTDNAGVVSLSYAVGADTDPVICASGATSTTAGANVVAVLTPTGDTGVVTTMAPAEDTTMEPMTTDNGTTMGEVLVDYMLMRGCNYSSALRGNQWLSDRINDATSLTLDFKEDGYLALALHPRGITILEWACQDMIGNETKQEGWLKYGDDDFCIRIYPGDIVSLLLLKQLRLDNENVTADLEVCQDFLDNQMAYSGLVKQPLNFENSTCPMPRGTYTIDYTDGFGAYCTGMGSTSVTVSSTEMSFANCGSAADAYDTPMTLTCIDTKPAWQVNEDGGEILFLGWTGGSGFYCARYSLADEGFTMSFHYGEMNVLECEVGATTQTNGTNYIQFDAKIKYQFLSPWTDYVYYIGKVVLSSAARTGIFNEYKNYGDTPVVEFALFTFFNTPGGTGFFLQTLNTTVHAIENWAMENYYIYATADGGEVCTHEVLHDILLLRVEEKNTMGSVTFSSCKTAVTANPLYRLYIQQDKVMFTSGLTVTEMAVPFGNDGDTYQMSFSYESSDICAGDASSTVMISGNTFVVTACAAPGEIDATLVTTTYTVYRTWSASLIGGDPADGDFILVGEGGALDTLEVNFRCGRYLVDSSGVISLSLSINSTSTTWCHRDHDATYAIADEVNKYVAFKFTPESTAQSVANAQVAGLVPPPEASEHTDPALAEGPLPDDPQGGFPHLIAVNFHIPPTDQNAAGLQAVAQDIASRLTTLAKVDRHRIRSLTTTGSALIEFVLLPGRAGEFSPLQAAENLRSELNTDTSLLDFDLMTVDAEITEEWGMIEEFWGQVPQLIVVTFQVSTSPEVTLEPNDLAQFSQQIADLLSVPSGVIGTHITGATVSFSLSTDGADVSLLEMSARLRIHVTSGTLVLTDARGNTVLVDSSSYSSQYEQDWICSSHPCANGATCRETSPHDYKCDCPSGYSGATCDWQTGLILRCLLIVVALAVPIIVIALLVVAYRRRQRRAAAANPRPSISNSSSLYEDLDDTLAFHPMTPKSSAQTRWFPDFKKRELNGTYDRSDQDC